MGYHPEWPHSIFAARGAYPGAEPCGVQANSEVSALLGRIPSAVGYQPTLATDLGGLQERITTTKKGSITSVQVLQPCRRLPASARVPGCCSRAAPASRVHRHSSKWRGSPGQCFHWPLMCSRPLCNARVMSRSGSARRPGCCSNTWGHARGCLLFLQLPSLPAGAAAAHASLPSLSQLI